MVIIWVKESDGCRRHGCGGASCGWRYESFLSLWHGHSPNRQSGTIGVILERSLASAPWPITSITISSVPIAFAPSPATPNWRAPEAAFHSTSEVGISAKLQSPIRHSRPRVLLSRTRRRCGHDGLCCAFAERFGRLAEEGWAKLVTVGNGEPA